jgi:prepilin peptidase CpaA
VLQGACAALVVSAALAGWNDVRHRRIPNWLCTVTALAGLGFAVWLSGFPAAWSNGLHFLIALVAGMLLFRMGVFGGGDAKYYAAVAAWFSLGHAVMLLLAVTLSGLVLLVVWFSARRLAGIPVRRKLTGGMDALPYGIAIGAGAAITAALQIPSAAQIV